MKRILYYESPTPLIPLAEACLSLTPHLFTVKTKELFLEISSTQKLFGGETGILFKAENLAAAFATERTIVVTDRPEWAKPLAISHEVFIPPNQSQTTLLSLPVERLTSCGDPFTVLEEEPERTSLVQFMRRVGMNKVSDFALLPATAVNRRFGKTGITLQDWTLGRREFIFPPFHSPDPINEYMETDEISSLESLLLYLKDLLTKIELRLKGRALLAKQLKITFHLESRSHLIKTLDLAHPLQEAQDLEKLLREFLNNTQWDAPLHRLEIQVSNALPWSPAQLSLFDTEENHFHDLAEFVCRLRTRLGNQSVGFPQMQENHLPEKSWSNAWPPPKKEMQCSLHGRPLFIFSPPKPFSPPSHWQLFPSEDLASEWWEEGVNRSYFIADNPQGEPLWVFFDRLRKEWFLHGIFD